jgi:hypothetical protein
MPGTPDPTCRSAAALALERVATTLALGEVVAAAVIEKYAGGNRSQDKTEAGSNYHEASNGRERSPDPHHGR